MNRNDVMVTFQVVNDQVNNAEFIVLLWFCDQWRSNLNWKTSPDSSFSELCFLEIGG